MMKPTQEGLLWTKYDLDYKFLLQYFLKILIFY